VYVERSSSLEGIDKTTPASMEKKRKEGSQRSKGKVLEGR
jgi:hypothetical protein